MKEKKVEDMTIKEGLKRIVKETLEDYPLLPQVIFFYIPFYALALYFLLRFLQKM